MKKTPIVLTVGLFVLVFAGIYAYKKFYEMDTVQVWNLISDQTVLVYEKGECENCINDLKKTSIWAALEQVLLRGNFTDSSKIILDFILSYKRNWVASLHATSKDNFDFVYYVPQVSFGESEKELKLWKGIKGVNTSQREFNSVFINEIGLNDKVFSWVLIEDLWIGSFTSFLIEDAIRMYKSTNQPNFRERIGEVYQLPRVKNDPGNIYIHLDNLKNWLENFVVGKSVGIPDVGQATVLDIRQGDGSLVLNGFSLSEKTETNSLLAFFQDQSPVPFTQKQFISNRSAVVTNYGISDGVQLFNKLPISKDKNLQDSLRSYASIDYKALFSSLGNEISICLVEQNSTTTSPVLLVETSNLPAWLNAFDLLSKASEREDTLYFERYASYEIREIEIKNLPGKLFRPLVTGFDQSYYSFIGNTILISDRPEELKKFLSDFDNEEVWGKSVLFSKFLESTLLESNISVYLNSVQVWNLLARQLTPYWQKVLQDCKRSLLTIGPGAVQFSHLNESFYTNISWSYDESRSFSAEQRETNNRILATINQSIKSRPFVVRNHATRKSEVLVQDSLNNLYYFSTDGKMQWKVQLNGPISNALEQIDFFNNGKLQLFFSTPGKLHVIDRLGNYVDPFPLATSIQQVAAISVVDYDNSKKYRFLIADKSGRVWMFGKDGKNMEGWQPLSVGGELLAGMDHFRIRGKDFIVAIRKDGWVHLLNRRGESVKGFPLNLDSRPAGSFYFEPGKNLVTSNFVCVTADGTRIKFNPEGKITSREPLVKSSVDDQFSLIVEKNGKGYIVKRQGAKRNTLFDEMGKEILSNDFVGQNSVDVQFYDFGSGKVYITLTDLVQDLAFVYDGQGNLLTPTPIEATGITLKSEAGKITMFAVYDKTLTIQPL